MADDQPPAVSAPVTAGEPDPALRSLFESNPHPMWIFDVETLRFLAVNDAAIAQYGYSRDEFLDGMTIKDIRPPEDVPQLLEKTRTPAAGLDAAGLWRHRRKDGSILDVEITSHELHYAGHRAELVFAHDVTGRRETELARRASERLAEVLPVGVLRTDGDGVCLYANAYWREIAGLEAGEAQGRPWFDLLHPDDRARAMEEWSRVADGRADGADIEFRLLRRDASVRWVLLRAAPVRDEEGRTRGFVCGITDLTQRKQFEDQVGHTQKLEGIGRLAGGVAHDFNNLLTAIVGFTDLAIEQTEAGTAVAGCLARVREAADRASGITRQLLAFSKRQIVAPSVVDINDVLRRAGELLARLIGEDVELSVRPAPDLWPVRVDAGQLEQVLFNLAVNARDAMPLGGRLTLATSNVVIDEHAARMRPGLVAGDYASLIVEDTGSGIPKHLLEQVFEPYFTTKEHGTGLGLATCFGIVKQAGGAIWLYSEPGHGTTFHVLLPRVRAGAVESADEPASTAPARGNETVLLVEDERLVRELAQRALENRGYRVLVAEDGPGALALADGFEGPIDILVTDVVMPRMSGRELAEAIEARRPGTRVLFASGYTSDTSVHLGVLAGGVAFLQKPYTVAGLVGRIRSVLDGERT